VLEKGIGSGKSWKVQEL